MAGPGRCPEPSKKLSTIDLPISKINREWYRSHPNEYDPIHFGRNKAFRFDAPEGEYGVLYVGGDAHVAFIETFQITGPKPEISEAELRERSVSKIRTSRPLRLVNLAGSGGLARIGVDGRLFTAAYRVPQRWSRALESHPGRPDGILYRPRHDPARLAAALFERVADLVNAEELGAWIEQEQLLGSILDTYNVALLR